MSADYGGATINNVASKGNALPVQDLIATSPAMLVNAGSEFQNQMIGSRENQTILPASAAYYAANGTPAIDGNGTHVTWSTTTGIWS